MSQSEGHSEGLSERHCLLTCEHGGHRVPKAWAEIFRSKSRLLESHRGWDAGALAFARSLARRIEAPLVAATTTRLLVDLNRSPHNPAVCSAITRKLPSAQRAELIETIHRPHWQRVREALDALDGPVVHLAVHSFTPVLDGRERRFDIGLLYDPRRRREALFAARLQARLTASTPSLRVRRNAPYRGDADGLTTAMRREHSQARYLGVELEFNQATIESASDRSKILARFVPCLVATLEELL